MSSPWATIAKVEPVCLQDIISEQFALSLRTRDDHQFAQQLADSQQQQQQQTIEAPNSTAATTATTNDATALEKSGLFRALGTT